MNVVEQDHKLENHKLVQVGAHTLRLEEFTNLYKRVAKKTANGNFGGTPQENALIQILQEKWKTFASHLRQRDRKQDLKKLHKMREEYPLT